MSQPWLLPLTERMEHHLNIRSWTVTIVPPDQPVGCTSVPPLPSHESTCPRTQILDLRSQSTASRLEDKKGLHINTLPLEVFQRIVVIVKHDSRRYAKVCLAVCRHWHDAVRPLVWKTLRLHDERLTSFALKTWRGGSSFHQLLTLKVTLQNEFVPRCHIWEHNDLHLHCGSEEQYCGPSHAHEDCKAASFVVWEKQKTRIQQDLISLKHKLTDSLRQLCTFSLVIDNEPKDGDWCLCYKSLIPSTFFAKILGALPGSCRHLELDTKGADSGGSPGHGPGHICRQIGRLIPQLQSLRLHLHSLCPQFFLEEPQETEEPLQTFLGASPVHEWMTRHRKHLVFAELISSDGGCYGPGDDFMEWDRWNKLPKVRRRVSPTLFRYRA